jgi:hypothetical protein
VNEIVPGLWRWTAPHPAWSADAEPDSPADWEQSVGSVLYETDTGVAFFDPLLPPETARFWEWADSHVHGRHVSVLTTIGWHRRSRASFVKRYQASTSKAKQNLPSGVESFNFRAAGETMFWLPKYRALIVGDRILGDPAGGLRLCPESWMRYLKIPITRPQLRAILRPLCDLPVERVLVSHGTPLLQDGAHALHNLIIQDG